MGASAFAQLATGLTGSALHAVLLEVMAERARRPPKDLVTQHRRSGFCAPAAVNLRTTLEIDRHLLASAAEFEALELSPVAPLGTCSAVALDSSTSGAFGHATKPPSQPG